MSVSDLLEKIAGLGPGVSDQPEVPPPELVGFFVRWVRGLHQWKRSTLANFARVSLSTIERVERGERVSNECLERIAVALGYGRSYFTSPRRRLSPEEATAELTEQFDKLEPVKVRPLRTQGQVREIAKCHGFMVHRPDIGEAFDEDIAFLTEWFDLASFVINTPTAGDPSEPGRRRELYRSILACVQALERRGVTVLSGVMNAPQEGLPDWKVAVISITSKLTDPGALKRRVVLVDRRCVALPRRTGPQKQGCH